jgi:hypothetical protein
MVDDLPRIPAMLAAVNGLLGDDRREPWEHRMALEELPKRALQAIARLEAAAEHLRGVPLYALRVAPPPIELTVLATSGEERTHTVYGLVSTEEPTRVRYVGQSFSPIRRFDEHIGPKGAPVVREWVKSVFRDGFQVQMILLAKSPKVHVDLVEYEWITVYRHRGMADLNTDFRSPTSSMLYAAPWPYRYEPEMAA